MAVTRQPKRTTDHQGQGSGAARGAPGPADPRPAGAAPEGRAADDEGPAARPRRASAAPAPSRWRTSLREGLRLERVPDPCVLVLFGATGDLAHRKVLPALYHLWRTNLLPHEFVVLAIGRRPYDDETFRDEVQASLEKYSRVLPLDEAAWRSFAERIVYQRLDFDERDGLRRPRRRVLDADRRGARDARQPPLLPRHPAVAVRRDRRPARARRARPRAPRRRLAAGRHREAVRPRPRLGEAAQPRGRQGLPRVAGLPHRPLPGQGDRPEPAGLPVRQRHLRAALEPPLRRPRADHRGRVDRRREPRRVLRGDRRGARRPPEPPAPAGQPRRDGAAGDLRGRRPARREGQGPARDRERPARPRDRRRPRPVRPGLGRRRPRCPATARSRRSTRSRRPRRSSPPGSTIDDWRWSGVPVLPADRQAPAQARDRDRDPVPRGAASAVQGGGHRARRRTCWRSASSPTRGSCCASAPRCPASGSTSGR